MLVVHLEFALHNVVLEDLAAPQSSEEQVLPPQRADHKLTTLCALVQDVQVFVLVEIDVKMLRRADVEMQVSFRAVEEHNSLTVPPQHKIFSVLFAVAQVNACLFRSGKQSRRVLDQLHRRVCHQ